MANNIVEIVARFINEASSGIKQLNKDVDETGKKSEDTSKSTDKMSGSFDSLLKQFGVTLSVTGAVAAGFAFLKSTVDAYGESEVVAAQVNAVLQSTHQIAGVTANDIDNIADSLSKMSGQDDEAIKRGEALMLTFTKVGKEVFPQATEAALNMSMAMGTDLQSAIMQVGKALQEPIQGASALRRVGVQLSDQQEEQIKQFMAVNDIASAQAIILGELQTEFGGVAQMMGDTTVGSANKLKVAWGNLLETMGEDSAGVWRKITDGLTGVVEKTDATIQKTNSMHDAINRGSQLMTIYGNDVDSLNYKFNVMGERVEFAGYEYARAEQYGAAWSKMLSDQTEITYTANDAISTYVPNFSKLLDLSTNIADETQRYNDKQNDLLAKQAEVKAQIDELIAQGWSPLSEKVRGLQGDYDALGVKYQENAQKHTEAMGKIQYDLLVTKLSVDGLTDAEFKVAQQAGLMFGVFDQGSANAALAMDQVSQAVVAGKIKVQDMQRALDMLAKGYRIDVVMNIIQGVAAGNVAPSREEALRQAGRQGQGYAEGGIATGPTSGHWELLHGTEAVIPLQNGSVPVQLGGNSSIAGGGNTYQVVVQINSPINLMSESEAQTVLMPLVVQAIKQAEAEARL